ncbi:MAG: SDR family NAD(P)-dependent oxidoreductase [Polyangiaceae bacterium]|nr:SDR family NAD(P)-dependent oxidoreductase [Polyangiaceae bacterium]
MDTLQGKTAIVVGASSGVGKAAAKALVSAGVRVTAIARGAEGLERLRSEVGFGLETVRGDASEPALADRLLRELKPDLVVLAGGAVPRMAPLDEQTWESFNAPWESDAQAAFHFVKAAITVPLRSGSAVVVVSSGAAITGSSLSGGYAGAKRMQWFLARYGQELSDTRKLGIRFLALVPQQFIEGTRIGALASEAYGNRKGISGAEVMRTWFDAPMYPETVATAILKGLRGEFEPGVTAIRLTAKGAEALA